MAHAAGCRAVVTGAAGALGQALTQELMERGGRVYAIDLAPLAPAQDGARLRYAASDLNDPAATRSAMASAAEFLGGIDAVINVAGGYAWETLEAGQVDTWDRLYALNLRSAVVASQAALPHLQAGSSIVNIGALAALQTRPGMGAYAASKAGVLRLTEAMAEELKSRFIRVNAVLPSIIDTPSNRAAMPDMDPADWVAPRALARVIAFLVSDDAIAVTGACIPVRGRV